MRPLGFAHWPAQVDDLDNSADDNMCSLGQDKVARLGTGKCAIKCC